MLLDKYVIISNSCMSTSIIGKFYEAKDTFFIEYNNPFIGTFIPNDNEYLKLCSNYDYYLSLTPYFSEPKPNTKWALQSGCSRIIHSDHLIKYPVYHLEDIEIHCIHDSHDKQILKKFKGRFNIGENLEKIFVWSCSEIFNLHTESERQLLIQQFMTLQDRSVFLTNIKNEIFEDDKHISIFVKEWENKSNTNRKKDFLIEWTDQGLAATIAKEVIEKKFGE